VQKYKVLILQNRLAELSSQLEAAAIEVCSDSIGMTAQPPCSQSKLLPTTAAGKAPC
jgi:hypothetical protein